MAATLVASSVVVAAAPASAVKSASLSSNAAQMTFSPLRLAHARVVSCATRRTAVSAKVQVSPSVSEDENVKSAKGLIGALALGAAGSMLTAGQADAAQEVAQLAADNRPLVLLVVLGPAIGWVLFNILQPALRQLQNMIKDGSTPPPKKGRK